MAFKNRKAAARVRERPCEMCGCTHVPRDAAHIIDEQKATGGAADGDWNALSLCPSCRRLFEDHFRPKLFRALQQYGVTGLPLSWEKSNRVSTDDEGDA